MKILSKTAFGLVAAASAFTGLSATPAAAHDSNRYGYAYDGYYGGNYDRDRDYRHDRNWYRDDYRRRDEWRRRQWRRHHRHHDWRDHDRYDNDWRGYDGRDWRRGY